MAGMAVADTLAEAFLIEGGRRLEGRVRAARYFFHYELPKIAAWLRVVETRDPTCATMPEEAF